MMEHVVWALSSSLAGIGLLAAGVLWRQRKQLVQQVAEQRDQLAERDTAIALLQQQVDQAPDVDTALQHFAQQFMQQQGNQVGQHQQQQLNQVLTPLREQLQRFEQQVAQGLRQEAVDRASLRQEVHQLHQLNQHMTNEAQALTAALKGNSKIRGNWGEWVLERLLEQSGLQRGREYHLQTSTLSDDGQRLQPDVIIQLPEQRQIVIDSKLNLHAWLRYQEDEADNRSTTKHTPAGSADELVQAMRRHMADLSAKAYHQLPQVTALDFVFMFVPIEAAFAVAVQADDQLFQEAFDKHIVIVSPATLLATLRTIANIWRLEQQGKHAEEIARRGGQLYDKLVNFVSDLEAVGQRLDQARDSQQRAVNRLVSGRGNVIRQAEQLREMGVKTSKQLPDALIDRSQVEHGAISDVTNVQKTT